jgi:hypothetical protein
MLQMSMFEGITQPSTLLGTGCFASVHEHGEGWVFKRAGNRDGTLNWLEFCKHMQDTGQFMLGMPVIDRLYHVGSGYVVTMKRYSCAKSSSADKTGNMWKEYQDQQPWSSPQIQALELAFKRHMSKLGHTTYGFDDGHSGNMMYCHDTQSWIVTDPCSCSYRESLVEEDDFTLQ